MTDPNHDWVTLSPPLRSRFARSMYLALTRSLARVTKTAERRSEKLEEIRQGYVKAVQASRYQEAPALIAAGLVVMDLVVQGWTLRMRAGSAQVRPPERVAGNHLEEKTRVRQQELIKRNSQLSQPSVSKFISSMEQARINKGRFVSIFSLMRDGRELAAALVAARQTSGRERQLLLARSIDPYLQFVKSGSHTCEFTGLKLMEVWRYFRHTWSNQYMSVPGRTMQFLVRDRAAPNHPVIGICALSSPIMQIRERDNWIGWSPDCFLAKVQSEPSLKMAKWLRATLDDAILHIYVDDLLEDGVVSHREMTNPTDITIERLANESALRRKMHHRFVRRSDHQGRQSAHHDEYWIEQARTHLFRSKRALALATLLRARKAIRSGLGSRPTRLGLAALAATREGQDAIRVVLRKAKADRVGISMADISVCGAVQPYNAILGGKLVAMLAASPEVVSEYGERYRYSESEIASSMAARSVIRKPHLVFLGTTSLYGIGSSQYNRIRIPGHVFGGQSEDQIEYKELGHSDSFGTSQYSDDTVQALTEYAQQCDGGQRVNSIFGEGISPKLRKVRQGLDALGFPSSLLLQHHRRRLVYGVTLVHNLFDYLVGADKTPRYLCKLRPPRHVSERIADWWRERWLSHRIDSDDVIAAVERHNLVAPIRHGARAPLLGSAE